MRAMPVSSLLPSASAAVLVAMLPAGALAQPADVKDLSVQQQEVVAVAEDAGSLEVTAWVDHDNNSYAVGEAIQLSVRANEDAYLTIVSVGPSGNAVLLYPNALQSGAMLPAGETVVVPGADAAAQIVATAPAGNELIRVIASSEPLEIIDPASLVGETAFRGIAGGAAQVARDLALAVTAQGDVDFYDKVIRTSESVSVELTMPTAAQNQAPMIATDATQYEVGSRVALAVTALSDCTLWVVNVSSDQSVHLIFPNRLMQENTVTAGQTVLVSGATSPVELQAAGPAGKESVFALCGEDATAPWEAGLEFTELFPTLDASSNLGRALVTLATDGGPDDPDETAIPDIFAWSSLTLQVVE